MIAALCLTDTRHGREERGWLSLASSDSGDSWTHFLPSCLGRISAAPAAMRRVILGRWLILGESSYIQISDSCLKC